MRNAYNKFSVTNFLDSFYYLMFNNCQQRRGEPLQILVVRNLKAVEVDLKIRPCRPETRWMAGPTWPFYLYLSREVNMMKKVCLFITTMCLFLVFVSDSYAHKVQMFAYAEGENVFVEGYFADGKKAMNTDVIVYDNSGKELLRGKTNDEGQFSFKAPQKSDLKISLNAGMGHKTEYTLPAGELHIGGGKNTTGTVTASLSKDSNSKTVREEKNKVSQTSRFDDAQLQAVVEKAVEKSVGEAIKPLVRSFTEMQQKNSLTTIIGGIGYIFGVMGIVLYFKSRRSS